MRPLDGIKVVELGTHVAVPKAARMMADWGAEVIKIEPPRGEAWRNVIPRVWNLPSEDGNNPIMQPENANKRSLSLNLKEETGREVLFKLLEDADVFLTNTRGAALEKLGINYEILQEKFPKLIFAHFTGFGNNGPEKDRPGFDVAAFWARSGALLEWGLIENGPIRPHPGFGDGTVASALLSGILAAIIGRYKTGKGDKIDISLYGTGLWYNSAGVLMGQPQYKHKYPKSKFNQTSPLANLYKTIDGDWIMMSIPDYTGNKKKIFEVIGKEHLDADSRFDTFQTCREGENMHVIVDELTDGFSKTSTKNIVSTLNGLDVVYEVLSNPNDIYKDEQAWANGYLHELTMQSGNKVVLPTNPVQFNGMEKPEFNPAPLLGEHTKEILKTLGYDSEKIKEMIDKKVVKSL